MREGLLGAKAPRPSGRCLRQRSLASLESNLSRSFSSFPMGQNIEYRRIIGLRCFLEEDGGGEGLLGAKAPRPSGRCLRQRSLASLESNLSRSFSSFPVGQNIEYRRVIGLRCFLRRWWWGKDYSALKRLALRAVACGNVLSLRSSRTLVEASHPSPWGRI